MTNESERQGQASVNVDSCRRALQHSAKHPRPTPRQVCLTARCQSFPFLSSLSRCARPHQREDHGEEGVSKRAQFRLVRQRLCALCLC
eukprot:1428910-Pleurochrysis_carterae.AAC.1